MSERLNKARNISTLTVRFVFLAFCVLLCALFTLTAYKERQMFLLLTIDTDVADSSTLYLNYGEGFNADDRIDFHLPEGITTLKINFTDKTHAQQLRWDPVFLSYPKSVSYTITSARWLTDQRLLFPWLNKHAIANLSNTNSNGEVLLNETSPQRLSASIQANSSDPSLYFHFTIPSLPTGFKTHLTFLMTSIILVGITFCWLPVFRPSK